jgi:alpha-N-arabinofuranosidase
MLEPNLTLARDILARLDLESGATEEAITQSRLALRTNPNDVTALYRLILALKKAWRLQVMQFCSRELMKTAKLTMAAVFTVAVVCSSSAQSPVGVVKVAIDTAKPAGYQIPSTIFGTFLEPIGNSTYNGLWAEILQNPSLEENLWSASAISRMVQDEPALVQASQLGLPLPWEPLDAGEGNRYEPRWGDAANSWRSLAILGLPGRETGIKQKVFLPVYRELRYAGSIYVKHLSGPGAIHVSIRGRNHPERVLSSADVNASATEWRKYTFTLDLPTGQLKPLDAADFVITLTGDERALVDEISLMPLDAVDGLDPEIVAMAKSMKTSLVRFGGNFTSAYHWRDGIGPRDKRVNMLNIAWGIPEYNQFGTDEFLEFCRLVGAEPQIALNLGSGTPQEAADWVRYVDEHRSKHEGLLWELGNELWGNWNLGYPTLEELARRTLEFSKEIRSVDPQAQLIATGQDPDVYHKWNAEQLKDPPNTFNFLSTHFVVTTDRVEQQSYSPDFIAEAAFALPVELGRRLRSMQSQINEAGFAGRVKIAFTEWLFVCCDGNAVANAPRYDNMGGAIDTAGFFNMLLRNADIVPISDMTGVVEFAGIWKKRGRVYATPAYYTFRLYSTANADVPVAVENDSPSYDVHNGVTRLPEIKDVPYLDVVAAMSRSGSELTVFFVNRHLTQDIPAAISIAGFSSKTTANVESLYASSIYEKNDEVRPQLVTPVESTVGVKNSEVQFTFRHESITRLTFTEEVRARR